MILSSMAHAFQRREQSLDLQLMMIFTDTRFDENFGGLGFVKLEFWEIEQEKEEDRQNYVVLKRVLVKSHH